MTSRPERGNSMVGILISVVIIMVLMVALFKGSSMFGKSSDNGTPARKDGHGTTVIGRVQYDAKDTVCQSNLSQVRMAIQVFQTSNDEHFPSSLTELKGLTPDFLACPIGKEPYQYDPNTGKVFCPHPGHEAY